MCNLVKAVVRFAVAAVAAAREEFCGEKWEYESRTSL